MTSEPKTTAIADLCSGLLGQEEAGRLLVVGESETPWDAALEALDERVTRTDGPDAVASLSGAGRFSLGLVFPASAVGGDADLLRRLLASLRDRYARRVLVPDGRGVLALNEYLALGFERMPVDGLAEVYLFDPDAESRRREWNNARHWANPENFDRFRW